jgi:hypothetical protein
MNANESDNKNEALQKRVEGLDTHGTTETWGCNGINDTDRSIEGSACLDLIDCTRKQED